MEDPIASRTLLDAGRVLDHAPVGFCIFDADQHCVYANPWLLDALGVEATAIHGRDIDDVLAGADRPLGASIDEVIGSGTSHIEAPVLLTLPGDQPTSLQLKLSPVKSGEGRVEGASCLVQNVSDQYQAIEDSDEWQRLTGVILDAVPALISYIDR